MCKVLLSQNISGGKGEETTKNPRKTSLGLFVEPDRTCFPKRIVKFSTNHVHMLFHRV
jgi:hypothetical protein